MSVKSVQWEPEGPLESDQLAGLCAVLPLQARRAVINDYFGPGQLSPQSKPVPPPGWPWLLDKQSRAFAAPDKSIRIRFGPR